ncbi:hypothetical protein ACIQWZ_37055 [Streptomyces sp. NPDC098077]|uniref:DUF6197 family protein n=1 Tax=Streptomyces sp. NPDC098077 TaxID=3366093 RepID=UPI00380C278E
MFELNRRTPQELEKAESGFSRDVEVYVCGIQATQPSPDVLTQLTAKAYALSLRRKREDWLAWGDSGMPMTGDHIAAHAEAAIRFLQTSGWAPRNHRGIYEALNAARADDTTGRLSRDTSVAVRDILALLICATTGAPYAHYIDWDEHPARTVEEVLALLVATAAFARTYGPAQTAAA